MQPQTSQPIHPSLADDIKALHVHELYIWLKALLRGLARDDIDDSVQTAVGVVIQVDRAPLLDVPTDEGAEGPV